MFKLFVVIGLAAAVAACSGARPNPTDAQAAQAVQEVRSDLKLAVQDQPIRFVGLNNATATAPEGQNPELSPPETIAPPSHDELEAVALAQDGKLRLLAGATDEALALLESSLRLYPTLDALEPLASLLVDSDRAEALREHCSAARGRIDDTRLLPFLEQCHRGDVDGELLPWASAEDRAAFSAASASPATPASP